MKRLGAMLALLLLAPVAGAGAGGAGEAFVEERTACWAGVEAGSCLTARLEVRDLRLHECVEASTVRCTLAFHATMRAIGEPLPPGGGWGLPKRASAWLLVDGWHWQVCALPSDHGWASAGCVAQREIRVETTRDAAGAACWDLAFGGEASEGPQRLVGWDRVPRVEGGYAGVQRSLRLCAA